MSENMPQLPEVFFQRAQTYENAVTLKQEGSICVAPQIMYLPIYLYGETTTRAVMEDYRNAIPSWLRYHEEYQPDLYWGPGSIMPVRPLETLDCQYIRWPGRHVAENAAFQVLDHEFMSADEYVEYAEDPTGFMIRKILPRHFKNLDGLKMIDLSNAIYTGAFYSMIPFALPPVRQAIDAMAKTGEAMLDYAQAQAEMGMMFAGKGWPSACDYTSLAPFDVFNDLFRGLINATMDMIECPDEMLLAIDAATKIQVRQIHTQMKQNPHFKTVYFFLHNGTDYFMSPEQFGKFYWPGLKACMMAVIENGGIPHLFCEDKFDQKLDFLADFPKGKAVYHLINTDMKLAKKKLGGIACIAGGIDGVLLDHGTPAQVERNVRETLDILMPDGGYILDTSVSLDLAQPENLHALFDTARKYGAY